MPQHQRAPSERLLLTSRVGGQEQPAPGAERTSERGNSVQPHLLAWAILPDGIPSKHRCIPPGEGTASGCAEQCGVASEGRCDSANRTHTSLLLAAHRISQHFQILNPDVPCRGAIKDGYVDDGRWAESTEY